LHQHIHQNAHANRFLNHGHKEFSVNQILNPSFLHSNITGGPSALRQAYHKHHIPIPLVIASQALGSRKEVLPQTLTPPRGLGNKWPTFGPQTSARYLNLLQQPPIFLLPNLNENWITLLVSFSMLACTPEWVTNYLTLSPVERQS